MADQRLRLIAELKDNASAQLRLLNKELKETKRTPGMEQASKWMQGFNDTTKDFVKGGAGISSTMGAIGIGGITAAASLSVLVGQFKALADKTFAMKVLGKETGLTIDQISQWQYVGQQFHVSTESMGDALKTLGDKMVDFRRHRGELFGQLNQIDPKFAGKLEGEDTQHQLQDIFNWLGKIKDAAARNRWAKEFFGTDDVDNLLVNGLPAFSKALDDAGQKAAKYTPELQAQADLLNKSIVDFNQAWQNFELSVGPTVFAQMRGLIDDFKEAFDEIKGAWDWAKGLKDHPVQTIGKAVIGAIDQAARENGNQEDRATRAGGRNEGIIFDLPGAASKAIHGTFRTEKSVIDGLPAEPPKGLGRDGLLHKSSFDGGANGLLHLADFRSGSSEDPIAAGTKTGVLAAFRELMQQRALDTKSGGGKPDLIQASYEAPGALGFGGGSLDRYGLGDLRRHRGAAPSGSHPDDGPVSGFGKPRRGKWWTPERQAHAVGRLEAEAGLSEAGAEGLVSRWANVEAASGPTSYNPKSGAAGIGQWLGVRKHGFTVDYDSQLSHAINELNNNENGGSATRALRAATNAREGAIGASRFERAEHYNPRTGVDDWTGKSLAGAAHVHEEVAGIRRALPSLVDEARKARGGDQSTDGSIEAHIHLHEGRVKGTSARSTGIVAPPKVHLRRGPTMTQPSYEA